MLDDSAIQGFVLNTTDITESVRVEKEQRLKTRMQALSENSLDLILRVSLSGVIYYANPVVEDYTDIAPHTMLNRNVEELPFKEVFSSRSWDPLRVVPSRSSPPFPISLATGFTCIHV